MNVGLTRWPIGLRFGESEPLPESGTVELRDALLKIVDGLGRSVDIKIGDGNVTWNENQALEYIHHRGQIDSVRLIDDEPCEVHFEVVWDWLSSVSGQSPAELIKGENDNPASTSPFCDVYTVDLHLEIYESNILVYTYIFPYFAWDEMDYDLRAGQLSVSGKLMRTQPILQ